MAYPRPEPRMAIWVILAALAALIVGGALVAALLIKPSEPTPLAALSTPASASTERAGATPSRASSTSSAALGQEIPALAAGHVPEPNRVTTYNSDPPSSGPHWGRWAEWSVYDQEAPPDEVLVHNLEHGGVIISYNPDRVTQTELDQLVALHAELAAINPRVILTLRSELRPVVALTAWGYLLELESVDPALIRTFYDQRIARGPECREGRCP